MALFSPSSVGKNLSFCEEMKQTQMENVFRL